MVSLRGAISKVVDGMHLSETEAVTAMEAIMSGDATPAQVAAFITALRMKGETVAEIAGCARIMREHAVTIRPQAAVIVDTCGTGGDQSNSFNISTTAAFVVAGTGVAVAKHGNRSVSSRCGSADVLEALGVVIDLPPDMVTRSIDEVGMGFLFAPRFHPAMKHAVIPRREIGIRTIFNVLGPLTNPAGATAQVLGVYDPSLTEVLGRVLPKLDVPNALVVHGLDGLDEISISDRTRITQVTDGETATFLFDPESVGLSRVAREAIGGGDAEDNARLCLGVLQGEKGPRRDVVLLNAAAALVAGGVVADLGTGVTAAAESIDCGAALGRLEALKAFGQGCVADVS